VSLLHLVMSGLLRKKLRTLFTLGSILVAFVLFTYLAAIQQSFTLGIDVSGQDRMMVIHKISLIQPLPMSYLNRLQATEGVVAVTHASWFGGKYQDNPEGRFGIFPVDPEPWMAMYPEYLLEPERMKAWLANRTGVVVGRRTADDFDWEVGDRVPIQGTIFRKADGGDIWEFTIDGIYEGAESGTDATLFFMHYDYFNESRIEIVRDNVGWYIVRIADPDQSAEVARTIDRGFENSPAETETTTEKAFIQGFANQIGNIGKILRAVMTAVFFTILLVAANTMAQSVRERTSELAVLKTLGFTDRMVLTTVLSESLLLAGLAGALGLGTGATLIAVFGDPTGGFLPVFFVPDRDWFLGVALVFALGIVAGLLPAIQAMRLQIVDALRRV
jgi:putative ABC transport system permease protein